MLNGITLRDDARLSGRRQQAGGCGDAQFVRLHPRDQRRIAAAQHLPGCFTEFGEILRCSAASPMRKETIWSVCRSPMLERGQPRCDEDAITGGEMPAVEVGRQHEGQRLAFVALELLGADFRAGFGAGTARCQPSSIFPLYKVIGCAQAVLGDVGSQLREL